MGDKIEEIFEIIGTSKKNLLFTILMYIVILLIILAIIWWPKTEEYATYEKVNMQKKKEALAQDYLNTISDMLKQQKKSEFTEKLSGGYLDYVKKSEEQVLEELEKAGFFSPDTYISGMQLYVDGDTYVYSSTMYNGNNKRDINIIEKTPYVYSISLDNFYLYNENVKTETSNNIVFSVENIYRNMKYIEINMKINNKNNVYARFDFGSTVGVQAVLSDGTKVSLSNLVSEEIYTNVASNATISKNFVFEIPVQLQEGIEYILFNDVVLEFSKTDIMVDIY